VAAQGEGVVGRDGLGDRAGAVGRGGEAVIGKGRPEPGARVIDLPFESSPQQIEREAVRIAAELATAKSTPGHSWCATCGANKPHEHHHVCGSCDRFIGCRQPVMHCECGAEIRSFDAPDGAK